MTVYIAPDCPAAVDAMIRRQAAERGEQVMPARPFPWNRQKEPKRPPPGPTQYVLPGAERDVFAHVSAMTLAPLKPKAWQKPCDHGLFSDQAAQSDLVDLARKP
jgi:hypothetical protein